MNSKRIVSRSFNPLDLPTPEFTQQELLELRRALEEDIGRKLTEVSDDEIRAGAERTVRLLWIAQRIENRTNRH